MDRILQRCNEKWGNYIHAFLTQQVSFPPNLVSFLKEAEIKDGGIFENSWGVNYKYNRKRHALVFEVRGAVYQLVRQESEGVLVKWNVHHWSGEELQDCFVTPKLSTFFGVETGVSIRLVDFLENSPFRRIAHMINNIDAV